MIWFYLAWPGLVWWWAHLINFCDTGTPRLFTSNLCLSFFFISLLLFYLFFFSFFPFFFLFIFFFFLFFFLFFLFVFSYLSWLCLITSFLFLIQQILRGTTYLFSHHSLIILLSNPLLLLLLILILLIIIIIFFFFLFHLPLPIIIIFYLFHLLFLLLFYFTSSYSSSCYPLQCLSHSTDSKRPRGKLRLLNEVAPLSFLVEQVHTVIFSILSYLILCCLGRTSYRYHFVCVCVSVRTFDHFVMCPSLVRSACKSL